jgi:hypothetical protein
MRVKALGVFVLAFCAAVLPVRGQDQNSPPDEPAAQQQPADAAPIPQSQEPPQAIPPESGRIVPPTLTLPAGVLVTVRVNQWLSSDRNHPGDTFSAILDQPMVVQGWVVARRGQTVLGRVDVAQKAGQGKGVSQLGLEITELTLVDGEQVPVSTEMQQASPSPAPPGSAERNVAAVGTTTVLGTIAGAAIGGGQGAAIGAGLGATAGLAAVLYTRGRPTTVAPETQLSFRLQSPVEISTERGRIAFQPVTQTDYKDQDAYANPPRLRRPGRGPGYPPPYYYYGYCGPWGWNCYPGPYWGWGAGVWVGPRFGRFRR